MKKQILVSLAIMILGSSLLTGCQKEEVVIDATKNVKLSFSGESGKGKAKFKSNYIEDDGNRSKDVDQLENTFSYTLKPNKDLYNGNDVIVTVKYDKELAEKLNIKVEHPKTAILVTGLKERKVTDKDIGNVEDMTGPKQIYENGESSIPTNFPDYSFSDYDKAYIYASLSSQEYNIVPTRKDGQTIYTVVFNTHPEGRFQGNGEEVREDKEFYPKGAETLKTTYEKAYEYGQASSQSYKVDPIIQSENVKGFHVVFM